MRPVRTEIEGCAIVVHFQGERLLLRSGLQEVNVTEAALKGHVLTIGGDL